MLPHVKSKDFGSPALSPHRTSAEPRHFILLLCQAVKSQCRMDTAPLPFLSCHIIPGIWCLSLPSWHWVRERLQVCPVADLCHLHFPISWTKRWAATKDSTDHQPTPLQPNDIQKYPAPFPQGALWYNRGWIKSQHLEIHYNCTVLFTRAPTAVVTVQLHVTIYKWQCSYSNFTNYREIAPTMLRGFHSDTIEERKNKRESYSNWVELVQAFGFLGL